jgi:hypothetical protein
MFGQSSRFFISFSLGNDLTVNDTDCIPSFLSESSLVPTKAGTLVVAAEEVTTLCHLSCCLLVLLEILKVLPDVIRGEAPGEFGRCEAAPNGILIIATSPRLDIGLLCRCLLYLAVAIGPSRGLPG